MFPLISSSGCLQLINEPRNIQKISSSCIGLIYNDQPNLSVNSGVDASLHPNCHHQTGNLSFNLNIFYPSPLSPVSMANMGL